MHAATGNLYCNLRYSSFSTRGERKCKYLVSSTDTTAVAKFVALLTVDRTHRLA